MAMRLDGQMPLPAQWVLIANANRARCFERDPDNEALREIASFLRSCGQPGDRVRPARPVEPANETTAAALRADRPGAESPSFARAVADYLDEGALTHRYPALAVVASDPFLGDLCSQLGAAARKLVIANVPLDLTGCDDSELEERVSQMLELAA